jgi:hypothetical protein
LSHPVATAWIRPSILDATAGRLSYPPRLLSLDRLQNYQFPTLIGFIGHDAFSYTGEIADGLWSRFRAGSGSGLDEELHVRICLSGPFC